MNVIDYSIKVGKLLRETDEGKPFLDLLNEIEGAYCNTIAYSMFTQVVNDLEAKCYFSAWKEAYNRYLSILNDRTLEENQAFMNTAELLKNDDRFKELVDESLKLERVFQIVSLACMSGGDIATLAPKEWKFRLKDSISDIQLSVKRTLMGKYFGIYNLKKKNFLDNPVAKRYLDLREKNLSFPFSQEAYSIIYAEKELPGEEKELYEKMLLIREAISKGVFYGFREKINEINENEIIAVTDDIENRFLHEVTITHSNITATMSDGWLYKIYQNDEYYYFFVYSKEVRIEKSIGNATIKGIAYPKDDRKIFETQILFE